MTSDSRRVRIGSCNGLGLRQVVFRISDGIEVDDIDHCWVRRKRVFFDEVVMVTMHRWVSIPYAVGFAAASAIFLVSGAAIGMNDEPLIGRRVSYFAVPFLLLAALHVFGKTHSVTIMGRRSLARIDVRFRRARAEQLFAELAFAALDAQEPTATSTAPAVEVGPPVVSSDSSPSARYGSFDPGDDDDNPAIF